jgi:transcription-repair coupling factor (superfamily II helicase)
MHIDYLNSRLEVLLDRQFDIGEINIEVVGTASTFPLSLLLAHTNSKHINKLPHLVVVASLIEAESIRKKIMLLEPNRRIFILPHYDVSPYSTLLPNTAISSSRIHWLFHAQNSLPSDIFIAPIGSLQQRTLPFNVLSKNSIPFGIGDVWDDQSLLRSLSLLGYEACPLVEDLGQFANRGGIFDIYCPSEQHPVRIELFGDQIESLRLFSTTDQRTLREIDSFTLVPAREVLYSEDNFEKLIKNFKDSLRSIEGPIRASSIKEEADEVLRSLLQKNFFPGIDYLLPYFFDKTACPLEHFSTPLNIWWLDSIEIARESDSLMAEMRSDFNGAKELVIKPKLEDLFSEIDKIQFPLDSKHIEFNRIDVEKDLDSKKLTKVEFRTIEPKEISNQLLTHTPGTEPWLKSVGAKLKNYRDENFRIIIFGRNNSQSERLKSLFDKMGFSPQITSENELLLNQWCSDQDRNKNLIHILPLYIDESIRIDEDRIVFLRDDDFFGQKSRLKSSSQREYKNQADKLTFGDLNPGDFVVHIKHGIGQYEGLRVMPINGIDAEFIQISYKDKDKLYLPVYRVGQLQKYSSASAAVSVDKLGGVGWEKAKIKVKNHLREVASDLLALYAKRSELHRPAFHKPDTDFSSFEAAFPYDETNDQLRAISDVVSDMISVKPMDRLVCGDVGFGKTEVAMRAAFLAVQNQKQVALLAPTTVLTFQHLETFKTRFQGWPIIIKVLNRFLTGAEVKQTLQELKENKIDILIGTHRLLSKDVQFGNLGLLIIDEEQKFGVTHKERIKKFKTSVDTLTLSATPIPRTLNMSLVGIRDLSFINTAPVDRLPTRTFVCKFEPETIRKAILAEIARGGQIYFIHNRIQSIYGLADELRALIPEARIRVGHGQMEADELESTMVAFFNHEIDVLLCTTIVESGMDVSRANTMFIDSAHALGLSQLYQLRGRVGRSKQRAYCYLLVPKTGKLEKIAQERLKVIQESTALGSGLKVAQHDLELRGAGNILGEEQSGHANLVGYELYMELLSEALAEAKGENIDDIELDPEINLRIPAMIPDTYISDIRLRLSYYKALSNIRNQDDLIQIEDDLKDQFGSLPEPVLNLMGLMLLRSLCKELGVQDLSAGAKTISLVFTAKTPLKPEQAIQLAVRENKKYSITPDNRLNIRMNTITIQNVFEELTYLLKIVH